MCIFQSKGAEKTNEISSLNQSAHFYKFVKKMSKEEDFMQFCDKTYQDLGQVDLHHQRLIQCTS